MNDNQEKQPRLSDDQMDQLLSVFYSKEVPPELDQLPSSWPEISAVSQPSLQVSAGTSGFSSAPSGNRAVAVVAALAACVVMVMLSFSGPSSSPEPESNFINVSGDGNPSDGVLDGSNTTLEEIDNIDLSPVLKKDSEEEPEK